jgi:Tfp pilus assembly protein PilF
MSNPRTTRASSAEALLHIAASIATLVLVSTALAQEAPGSRVTWARDVAPILQRECAPCHHPGGAGPFSLLTYEDARKRAKQIAQVTGRRYMPPWLPGRQGPRFEDARLLSDAQLATLAAWARAGAPSGDVASAPAPPSYPDGWQLGTPDVVLRAEAPWTLSAEGPDRYRNFVFRVPLTARRYVAGLEVMPGNRRVTHHANVYVDHVGWGRARDAEDPEPGFPGMDLQIASNRFDPDSHFLFYKPGTPAVREPDDMSWPLEPGDDLILNLHLRPTGKPETVAPSLGLYFTDRAPSRFPMLLQLEADRDLDIPPGTTAFRVSDALTLPVPVQLAAIYPHAHSLGHIVEAWATTPGGRRIPLIHIPDWDPAWQGVFRYATPIALPAGTRVEMRWEYDNSADNPRNPHDPPARVRAGNQTTDEMAHVWLQVIPRSRDDQAALQEALMRHRLERSPGDFSANANLGAVLQTEGRIDEAIAAYRKAIAARPDVASVRNALGTALQARGSLEDAIGEFEAAARLDPSSADPHYNWGNTLLALGRAQDALAHFERALAASPNDAAVLNDYGTACAMLGRMADARTLYERALAADPSRGDAHYNLARVLVQAGQLAASVPHYEAAVRLQKDNKDAIEELAAVRAALGLR